MAKETKAENEETTTLSREEKAFIIKALWESLQEPAWTKDDLIEFGKAIFAKKSLKKMDDKTFNRIFPFLEAAAIAFGQRLQEAQASQEAGASEEQATNEPRKESEAEAETETEASK